MNANNTFRIERAVAFFLRRLFLLTMFAVNLITTETAYAEDDYSDGMVAYLKGDYQLAQEYWLKSAKTNNPKSMFNLGLLHSTNKIDNANSAKADRWFKLAGQYGYAAADYHYAKLLLERGSPKLEIQKYLKRSVDNGYFPAKRMADELYGSSAFSQSFQSIEAAPRAQLSSEMQSAQNYLTETWINSKKSSAWTIQMLAFQNQSSVRAFIDEHNLKNQAAYFKEKSERRVLYKLVYGIYSTKELAGQARDSLPESLREHGPWLRSVASVQSVIKKQ